MRYADRFVLVFLLVISGCKPQSPPIAGRIESTLPLQVGVVGAVMNQKTGRHVWIECKVDQPTGATTNGNPEEQIRSLRADFEALYNAYNSENSYAAQLPQRRACKPMTPEASVSDVPEFLNRRLQILAKSGSASRLNPVTGIQPEFVTFLLAMTPCFTNTPISDGTGVVALSKLAVPALSLCTPAKMNTFLDYIVGKTSFPQGELAQAGNHRDVISALGNSPLQIADGHVDYLRLKTDFIIPYADFLAFSAQQQAQFTSGQNSGPVPCVLPSDRSQGINWLGLAPCLTGQFAMIGNDKIAPPKVAHISAYSGRFGLFLDDIPLGLPWRQVQTFYLSDRSGNAIIPQAIQQSPQIRVPATGK
jgi:hypothetical protein